LYQGRSKHLRAGPKSKRVPSEGRGESHALIAKMKFKMSTAAKAKISAAAKARWAKIKAQKKA